MGKRTGATKQSILGVNSANRSTISGNRHSSMSMQAHKQRKGATCVWDSSKNMGEKKKEIQYTKSRCSNIYDLMEVQGNWQELPSSELNQYSKWETALKEQQMIESCEEECHAHYPARILSSELFFTAVTAANCKKQAWNWLCIGRLATCSWYHLNILC